MEQYFLVLNITDYVKQNIESLALENKIYLKAWTLKLAVNLERSFQYTEISFIFFL